MGPRLVFNAPLAGALFPLGPEKGNGKGTFEAANVVGRFFDASGFRVETPDSRPPITARIGKPKRQRAAWPKVVTAGSVSVKVYRARHATNACGFSFIVAWHTAGGRTMQKFASEEAAIEEAAIKAQQIAAGRIAAANMSGSDRDELQLARQLAQKAGRTLLAALEEYAAAHAKTGGHVADAAHAWAEKMTSKTTKILFRDLCARACKEMPNGAYTVGRKIGAAVEKFGDRYADEISTAEWVEFLSQWESTTRNDKRARLVTVFRWARNVAQLFPRDSKSNVEFVPTVENNDPKREIITPETFGKVLAWVAANAPQYLAQVTLAGFCGLRSVELHGKIGKDGKRLELRQTWEDIDTKHKRLTVTNAKTGTVQRRIVPLCDAAVAWLKRCPGERAGYVGPVSGMQEVRDLLTAAGFELPDNCFRHSFISYRAAQLQSNAQTAIEAGNTEPELVKHYKQPMPQEFGAPWQQIFPKR